MGTCSERDMEAVKNFFGMIRVGDKASQQRAIYRFLWHYRNLLGENRMKRKVSELARRLCLNQIKGQGQTKIRSLLPTPASTRIQLLLIGFSNPPISRHSQIAIVLSLKILRRLDKSRLVFRNSEAGL